ncbi:serine hydrolase [Ectobacillus ponti]|uniref:Class A beta-lactamase-related serine hydrolase n=1 Tax=Ectobacillus ponti TaxID=2961894 RepID=A0AA41X689_9BACI|nr:serine hydrolase [Ectobacillus ponti]MCP8967953.1 class A beta-lactamase-related serine hydrolase [Ectobacillus ponti]
MTWQREIEHLLQKAGGKVSCIVQGDLQFEYGANVVHRAASLIKLPILAAALQQLDMSERVPCAALGKESGLAAAFSPEAALLIEDICLLMMAVSDNAATNWLIERLGMPALQREAASRGMVLGRRMLQSPAEAGGDNLCSARQVAGLLAEMDSSPLRDSFYKPLLAQQLRQQLPGLLEYRDVVIANKTGSLQGVLHDAARLQAGGKTVYIAVLMSELSDVAYAAYLQARIGQIVADQLEK